MGDTVYTGCVNYHILRYESNNLKQTLFVAKMKQYKYGLFDARDMFFLRTGGRPKERTTHICIWLVVYVPVFGLRVFLMGLRR